MGDIHFMNNKLKENLICEKCNVKYLDSFLFCPKCATPLKEYIAPQENSPEDFAEEINIDDERVYLIQFKDGTEKEFTDASAIEYFGLSMWRTYKSYFGLGYSMSINETAKYVSRFLNGNFSGKKRIDNVNKTLNRVAKMLSKNK